MTILNTSEALIGKNRFCVYLVILCVLQFTFYYIYGHIRHLNYLSSINDLGHYDQAIWGFLKGAPFLNTDIFNQRVNRLGVHFDPILALFVPAYFLKPSVSWLISAQSLAIALASWPIFLLARELFHSDKVALIWATIFSFNAYILNAAASDFHAATLAVPFISFAYLALEKKLFNSLAISCLFILLCKEHFGLLVIGFAALWAIKYKEWQKSSLLFLIGALHVIVVMKFIMPHFSPTGKHLMISSGLGQLSRYAWLGGTPLEIVSTIIKSPLDVLSTMTGQLKGHLYLTILFLQLLALPLFGIEFLLPGVADLLANLLSANHMPRSLFSYHTATLIPVFTIAAMYGTKRAAFILKRFTSVEISSLVLISIMTVGLFNFPFLQVPVSVNSWNSGKISNVEDPSIQEIKALLGDDYSISVQANVGAHFTQRQEVYTYPNNIDKVDAIVLRLESPIQQFEKTKENSFASFGYHLQMNPEEYLESIEAALNSGKYTIALWKDPWLLMTKGNSSTQYIDSVRNSLRELESDLQ